MQAKSYIDRDQLAADVNYSDNDLDSAFMTHPGLVVRYGMLHADAVKQHAAMKLKRDVVEAQVHADLKQRHIDNKEKFTEAGLSKEVIADRRYIAAYSNYIKAQEALDEATQAIEALRHRRDVMVQSAKSKHMELTTSPDFAASKGFAEFFAAARSNKS